MLKYLDYNKKNSLNNIKIILNKRKSTQKNKASVVRRIISNVKKNGDKAVIKYEKQFSKIKIKSSKIIFSKKEINKIAKKTDKKIRQSIDLAFNRIKKFHSNQKFLPFKLKDKYKNELSYKFSPIEKVGVYVPGGTASYPSTVLMNCIPAIVAGVKNIYLTTPSLGISINPAIIYAAKKCGVKKIYKTGGAHSIAALAYGTKTFQKVDKIVGPGNTFVANAKKEVFGDVGIDMVAGPSEVTIVADKYANPNWIAADLIAQAEHDTFAQSILITSNQNLIKSVNECLKKQLNKLPKQSIASKSLRKFGLAIYANNKKDIIEIINNIAPEHLELNIRDYKKVVNHIRNAGSICMGKYAVMAMTDYNVGTNHVLPTNSSARYSSGISVNEFYKRISYVNLSKKGIETLGPSAITLANFEGLEGHAKSIELRIRRK